MAPDPSGLVDVTGTI